MVEIRQESIYIDVCKNCRGVFLDAGELEALLWDSHESFTSKPNHHHGYEEAFRPHPSEHREYDHYEKKPHKHYHGNYQKKSKMKHILGELFDF